jgi:hypothetical protein
MTYHNGKCEHNPTLNRQATNRTEQEIISGQLWAEIDPPKLLANRTNTSEVVIQ